MFRGVVIWVSDMILLIELYFVFSGKDEFDGFILGIKVKGWF